MSAGIDRAFSLANVRLAWLRTRNNAEPLFKNCFRHIYRAYSLAEESNLTDLRNRLVKDFFDPSHPAKLHFPKKSGLGFVKGSALEELTTPRFRHQALETEVGIRVALAK